MSEQIDFLNQELSIIQKKYGFKYGIDSVLLADFVDSKGDILVDLGTGSGIVPILLERKNNFKQIIGLDIQKEYIDMAKRSAIMNGQDEIIEFLVGDLMNLSDLFSDGSISSICTNPPYFKSESGIVSPDRKKAIARNEILMDLEGLIYNSSRALKNRGDFFIVYRPNRLAELIHTLKKYTLEPKRLRFIYPKEGSDSNMLLLHAKKNAGEELKVLPPLYVYEGEDYTREILEIYNEVEIDR